MLRHLLIFLFGMVMCANTLPAQDQRVVDSLHNVLKYQSGADRFPALYDLTFEFVYRDNHKALQYIEQAAEASLLSNDSLWIAKSIRVRGQLLYAIGRHQEALLELEQLRDWPNAIRFGKEYFEVMHTVGNCFLFTSRFDKALDEIASDNLSR